MKRYYYPYLDDALFLKEFDKNKLKQQFVKITVLDFKTEQPLKSIEGIVLSGSVNIDGSSAMRRTANLSLLVKNQQDIGVDLNKFISINKKIQMLIGFTNNTDKYTNYPIIWFPMGIYVIMSKNINIGKDGTTIALNLHDKMALLNGECGGTLPASVTFSQVQDIDENGDVVITQPTIYQIIQQLVNHFGGEQIGNIMISGVDDKIKSVMRWLGDTPLYCVDQGSGSYLFTTNLSEAESHGAYETFTYGDDVGYILTDFVFPTQLVGNAGASLVSILDQIKNTLGNYEYFYDLDGNFRFQQIKNYLNTSYATYNIAELRATNYLVNFVGQKSVYTLQDDQLIASYNEAPQIQNIKNDFLIWGKRKDINGNDVPIRYHLAIDSKPAIGNEYQVFFFTDPDDGIEKAKKVYEQYSSLDKFPKKGDIDWHPWEIYKCGGAYYRCNPDYYAPSGSSYIDGFEPVSATEMRVVKTKDYRTQLYLQGIASQPQGLESNYYYTELCNEWPKLYDIDATKIQRLGGDYYQGEFYQDTLRNPDQIDFFLDLIDSTAAISEFSIQNIGRRTVTIVDDSINCIFEPQIPDVIIIESGLGEKTDAAREQCIKRGRNFSQVSTAIYSLLANGGVLKSAYEQIRKELYQYTDYNEQASFTILPIYYLEPNTRITVKGEDYMVKSFSISFDINSTMTLSCSKILERI